MKPDQPPPLAGANAEIAALIQTLHETGHRLEELTAGEVDSVADPDGRTFLLLGAQEMLRHSEAAKQAAILNALPANIALLDTQGLIVSVNEAWRRFAAENSLQSQTSGLGADYLRICDVAQGDDAGLAHQAAAGIRSVLTGVAGSFALEYPSHSPAQQRWFLMIVTPLGGDHVHGAVVMHLNVTERKQAEQALRESAAELRAIFDSALDGILVADGEAGNILAANTAICGMLGYRREAMLRLSTSDIYPKQALPLVAAHVERVLHGDTQMAVDIPMLRQDGSVFYADIKSSPLRLAGKACVLGLFRDITQRKATEEQVLKLSLAVEQSLEGIVITDLDANVEYVNEAFVRNSGYSREEIIGRNPRMLQSGKTPQGTFTTLWSALDQGLTWQGEFINRRKDASEYVVAATITPLRQADGHVSHYVEVKEDVTEKKRTAEELERHRHHLEELVATRTRELAQAKAAAEAANEAKSAFVANMSHEIRTPLNAIVGLTHLLLRGHADPAQREKLAKIVDASQHLLLVINDILDFSKIDAGKLRLSSVDFAFDRMVDNVMSMIGPRARDKRLEIVVERHDLPPVLVGDATRLAQALLNYLANAVKFTEQGKVTVSIAMVEETTTDLLARFEVTDTGIGIAPAKIADLFAAFEQVDASAGRRYGGTGLGLAITRRLARLMGGEAGAQSRLGQGSSFWFTARMEKSKLSLEELAEVPAAAEHCLQAMPAGARILLVEDNPINQEVAMELLTGVGLKVEVANNGFKAVNKVCGGSFDLILMDIQMPGMDGLEATRLIRALPGCATLPIVAMTANAFDEDRELCIDAGMNDFVAKPVDPEQLFGILLRWLPVAAISRPTTAIATNALPAALVAIPGLDTELGLKMLNGRLPAYLRLLRRYAVDHADDIARLRNGMARGERDVAMRLAHTLKGASGTLGVTSIQHLVAELEAAIQDGRDAAEIERLTGGLETELQRLVAAICAALPEEPVAPCAVEVDWLAVRQLLADLEPLLAASSMRANRVIETRAALLHAAFGPLGAELAQQIEHFLYPEAMSTLKRVLEKFPELAAQ